MYIPLHAHFAKGSVGDAVTDVKKYVLKAKEMGLTHLAITDHGSLSAAFEFYDICQENSIVPIIGMEAYITNDRMTKEAKQGANCRHLVLLAQNDQGIKDLIAIHNDSQLIGFYYKPRTDFSVLTKYGKNLIGLSACVGGDIPQLILQGKVEEAIKTINSFKKIFSNFYLEVQPGSFAEQVTVNDWLVYLSSITNTPLVATNDIHYLNAEDCSIQELHSQSCQPGRAPMPDKIYYLMNEDELKRHFVYTNNVTEAIVCQAINNTNYIASKCQAKIDYNFAMPEYKEKKGDTTDIELLSAKCYESLSHKSPINNIRKYIDRLNFELNTINTLGFAGYFLIVADIIEYAKINDIAMGPGRGSCGSSLVSWLLGITIADPIQFGLMFERFLSPNRKGLPDIDLDIDAARRSEVIEYVVNKYGKENCCLVMTYGMRKAKAAIKDAARLVGLTDQKIVNSITKAIPAFVTDDNGEKVADFSIKKAIESKAELKAFSEQYPQVFEYAQKLQGLPITNRGVHPAGLLISPNSMLEKAPIKMHESKEGLNLPTICVTKDYAEHFAVKFDFLALATISVITKTQQDVGIKLNLRDPDFYKDGDVWKLISSEDTDGLFQISSSLFKKRMPRLRPASIQELAACIALVRPPCISARTDETYMQVEEGNRYVTKVSPEYDAITAATNGIAIYQEQIMKIAVAYGLSTDEGYQLLKACSKKKINKIMEMKELFLKRSSEKGVSVDVQNLVFKIMLDAGKYSFNASHAACYAVTCYVSAWLKFHYPLHFAANFLSNTYTMGNFKNISNIVSYCKKHKMEFLPLDINKSNWNFTVENGKIRIGFCAIKGMGEKAVEEIVDKRPFYGLDDFVEKTSGQKVNRKIVMLGIFSGCFDTFGNRHDLYVQYNEEDTSEVKVGTENISVNISKAEAEALLLRENYIYNNESVSAIPSINFAEMEDGKLFTTWGYVEKISKKKDKRGQMMAFLTLKVANENIRTIVFGSVYDKLQVKKTIDKGNYIAIYGKKDGESCIAMHIYEKAS